MCDTFVADVHNSARNLVAFLDMIVMRLGEFADQSSLGMKRVELPHGVFEKDYGMRDGGFEFLKGESQALFCK